MREPCAQLAGGEARPGRSEQGVIMSLLPMARFSVTTIEL